MVSGMVSRVKKVGQSVRSDETMKYRELIRMIERDGWVKVAQKGSHRQYKHPTKKGRVTVAGKPNADVYPKMRKTILKQAGLL